jgi:hypothetical protein
MKKFLSILVLGTLLFTACGTPENSQASVLTLLDSSWPSKGGETILLVGEGGTSGSMFVKSAETYQAKNGGIIYQLTDGDDFVAALKTHFDTYGPIPHLEYFGHGNHVGLYVNQDGGVNGGLYANDPILDEKFRAASIYELPSDIFSEDAVLQFNGCNVAANHPNEDTLAASFADYFDRTVIAPLGPTEFKEENGEVTMIPTYESKGFVTVEPKALGDGPFKDVRQGDHFEAAVNALAARGLDLESEQNRFQPYKVITHAEAAEFCSLTVLDTSLCVYDSKDANEKIRNLVALMMLADANGANLPNSEPWYQVYVWWGQQHNLLPADFTQKKWFTRAEMAELTWAVIENL